MNPGERIARDGARNCTAVLLAGLLALASSSGPVRAQQTWVESLSPSERFIVLSSQGDSDAATLAGTIDGIHDGLSALFGGRLPGPITVRIHPSREDYLAANPLVARAGDVDAATRRARRAIDVYRRGPEAEPSRGALVRDVRYEMAHLFIARKSGGRMAPGMQEGLARYLADRPSAEDEPGQIVVSGVARLRDAWRHDALKGWDELSGAGAAYLAPEVSQPQSLSIIHFLVEAEGLGAVLELVGASAESEGWRDAFDAAFSRAPSDLEAAWKAWLPGYLDGGWRHHELYVDGIDRAEQLIRSGRYEVARDRLLATMALVSLEDPGGAARAKTLLARAEQGLQDAEGLAAANQALADGRYADAQRLAHAVVSRSLDSRGAEHTYQAAEEISRRARIGLESAESLEEALKGSALSARAPMARLEASRAAGGFSLLGDEMSAERARSAHAGIGSAFAPVGFSLIAAGCAVLVRNVRRRRSDEIGGPVRSSRAAEDGRT